MTETAGTGTRWITAVIAVLLLAGAFSAAFRPVWDPDSYWHLAFGKYIFENGRLPHEEPFAFSAEGRPVADLSWLPHLAFFLVFWLGGYPALEISVSLLAVFAMGILILLFIKERMEIAALGLYFGLFFRMYYARFRLRPEAVSLVIFAALLLLLYLYRDDKLWFMAAFPLLFLLWAQVHSSWIYGLAAAPFFLLEKNGVKPSRRLFRDALWLLLMPVAAIFINPHGWKAFTFPFSSFLTMKDQPVLTISEWAPLSINRYTAFFLIFSALAVALNAALAVLKRKSPWLPLFAASQLAFLLLWNRYCSFAFIALAPSACLLLSPLFEKLKKFRTVLLAAVLLTLAVPFMNLLSYAGEKSSLPVRYPVAETDFMLSRGISGNLFHTYAMGGYLEFRGYPKLKTFFDGRTFEFLPEYLEYEKTRKSPLTADLERFVKSRPFEVAVIPYSNAEEYPRRGEMPRSALAAVFPAQDWAPVFYGPYGMVLLRKIPRFGEIIDRFGYRILFPYDDAYVKSRSEKNPEARALLEEEKKRAEGSGAGFLKERR